MASWTFTSFSLIIGSNLTNASFELNRQKIEFWILTLTVRFCNKRETYHKYLEFYVSLPNCNKAKASKLPCLFTCTEIWNK